MPISASGGTVTVAIRSNAADGSWRLRIANHVGGRILPSGSEPLVAAQFALRDMCPLKPLIFLGNHAFFAHR